MVYPDDLVKDHCLMFPIFCTANIPPNILDEFLDQSYQGCLKLGAGDSVGGAPCILTSKDLASVTHGSRTPTQPFSSPFLDMSVEEVRKFFAENVVPHSAFTSSVFAVMDAATVAKKTCVVAVDDGELKVIRTDFYAAMWNMVPLEMATMSIEETEFVGSERVFDREEVERVMGD
ncbi:hypothetical protein MMC30_006563 [Trapelia coarctata]|nr:hypothetical protein [Trapelia coarctata]